MISSIYRFLGIYMVCFFLWGVFSGQYFDSAPHLNTNPDTWIHGALAVLTPFALLDLWRFAAGMTEPEPKPKIEANEK